MTTRAQKRHPIRIVIAALFAIFATQVTAFAVVTCTTTCTNPSSPLTDDYVCPTSSISCITLTGGADLDLNGHTITAVSGAVPSNAIRCTAKGSVVTDTAATKGQITGDGTGGFVAGVEDCEEVDGLVVDEYAGSVVTNTNSALPLLRAANNTYEGVGTRAAMGIDVSATTRDTVVSDNTIVNVVTGIKIGGTTAGPGPLVINNTIDDYRNGIQNYGGDFRVITNTLTNRDSGYPGSDCIYANGSGYYFKNTCDCASDCPAVTDCTTTVVFGSGTHTLTSDYESNGGTGPCIRVDSGADLNLAGHTISHIGTGTGSAAIDCTASSSFITNFGGANDGRALIRGDWTNGTEDCERVTGVSFGAEGNGVIGTAIKFSSGASGGADQISGNIIDGTTNGIDVGKFASGSSYVDNNGIRATGTAIKVVGLTDGSGPQVTDNTIRGYDLGIHKTGTLKIRIQRNLLMERDSEGDCMSVDEGNSTVSGNICDCPEVEICDIKPPFVSPWF